MFFFILYKILYFEKLEGAGVKYDNCLFKLEP